MTARADEPSTVDDGKLPKVADVIERLGVGPFVIKETLLGGSIWLAAGSQIIMISAITREIASEWNLRAWQRGSIVSVVLVGIMLGNFTSGPVSDSLGRRLPILVSYAAVCVFGVASVFAPGFWSLCTARLLMGCAFGFSQPAWNTLCTEITPMDWRLVTSVASGVLFTIGEIYAASFVWLDDPSMKDLNWKLLTILGLVPTAIAGSLAVVLLNESASWLALHGKMDKAKQVLQSIRWWNRKEQEPVDFAPPEIDGAEFGSIGQQISVVLANSLCFTTIVMCFTCAVLNFMYYGMIYAFPFVLGEVDMGVSPAVTLILGALWELPGYGASLICNLVCGRRPGLLVSLALMACSVVLFIVGAREQKNGGEVMHFVLHTGYAGMKCWINMIFVLAYQYASEVYPTGARVVGTGMCLGSGRLGSIAAPFVFEGMLLIFDNAWLVFFYTMLVLLFFDSLLILLLPYETWGRTLKDHIDEMAEAEPMLQCVDRKLA